MADILGKAKIISNTFRLVFSKFLYIFLAAILSLSVFAIFVFLANIPNFTTAVNATKNLLIVFDVFQTAIANMIFASPLHFTLLVITTVLVGINFTFLIFKVKVAKDANNKSPLISFGGAFGGALAAGCPACPISLLAILGVSGGLAALPFRGIELSALAITLLIFSLYLIAKSIYFCKTCKVYFKSKL
jgi:hypothetical protein